jgi:Ice-binding-like
VTNAVVHRTPTPTAARPGRPPRRRRLGAASAATLALLTATGMLLDQTATAQAATAIGLGTAEDFAVLAGSGITNTGSTVITGDIGTFPTTTVTGDDAGQADDITLDGTHQLDATVTAGAKGDLLTAYNTAAGQASTQAISADLANPTATLTPGVYTSASSMGLTGALTLDGRGDADAVFVFQAVSALTTGPASSVALINGAQACNVFWQVGSSATLDTDTVFVGTILADDSISLNARAGVTGRVLASGGAVTMIDNVITRPGCTGPTTSTGTSGGAASGTDGTGQVRRVPVGSVDAGDGSSLLGRTPDSWQ